MSSTVTFTSVTSRPVMRSTREETLSRTALATSTMGTPYSTTTSRSMAAWRDGQTRWALQAEQGVQADGDAGPVGDRLHGQQHPRHERGAVRGVVADGERLPGGAEQHLLVSDEAAQAD